MSFESRQHFFRSFWLVAQPKKLNFQDLGGFESLALHQEYRETGNRKFLKLAKDEHLVRLHIGLEDPKDLIADLKKALKFIK